MTAHVIACIWWIVGTFGVAGLIAFWFLAPVAARLVLQAVVAAFEFVLSYRVGCALLAAIAVGFVVDYQRHAYDDAQFAARTALFEFAQKQRDDGIAQKTRDKVWSEIADATAANVSIDDDVKDFTNVPAAVPLPAVRPVGNPLVIDAADAVRLCHIAGQTQCGPVGSQGVSKARRPGGSATDKRFRLPHLIRAGTRPNQ
jgi:hypothetical protein